MDDALSIRVDFLHDGTYLPIPLQSVVPGYAVVGFAPNGLDRQAVEWDQVHPEDRQVYQPAGKEQATP
jgi:hypothetical protein